jgi:hypothetical protein
MRVLFLISILILGACTNQRGAALPTAWARADGQPVNSGLLDIDSLDCKDGIQKPEGANSSKADKAGDSRAMVDDFVSWHERPRLRADQKLSWRRLGVVVSNRRRRMNHGH